MGARAREVALARYSAERMCDDYLALYQQALAARRGVTGGSATRDSRRADRCSTERLTRSERYGAGVGGAASGSSPRPARTAAMNRGPGSPFSFL